MICFKPLQRGAGFLWSAGWHRSERCRLVSNPFSAGRDSSARARASRPTATHVSNPFSAGRDSSVKLDDNGNGTFGIVFQTPSARGGIPLKPGQRLVIAKQMFQTPSARGGIPLYLTSPRDKRAKSLFQTPSARGGIPLLSTSLTTLQEQLSFKPLQRGAGFLCEGQPGRRAGCEDRFKPLQRGAGFLCRTSHPGKTCGCVSNPFSAGRDSSGKIRTVGCRKEGTSFKPLQRGAGFLCFGVSNSAGREDHRFQTPSARGGIPLEHPAQ